MRQAFGWICYLVGGAIVILSMQMTISCEFLATFGQTEDYSLDFWQFVYHTSGHHRAFPHGYVIHWARDLFLFLAGVLVIRLGREQFVRKRERIADKLTTVTCPGCRRQIPPEAYCGYCGYNLVTQQPSAYPHAAIPFWKIAFFVYAGLAILLFVLNLVLIKLGLE